MTAPPPEEAALPVATGDGAKSDRAQWGPPGPPRQPAARGRVMARGSVLAGPPTGSPSITARGDMSYVEAPRERRRRWAAVGPIGRGVADAVGLMLVFALVLGGLGAASAFWRPDYHADALISVRPDPPVLNGQSDSASDAQDRFVQSQLLIINGPQLRAEVVRRLGLRDGVSITASQVGTTSVVQVTGGAKSRSGAENVADTAVVVYVEGHRADVDDRARAALSVVDQQLTAARAAMGGPHADPSTQGDAAVAEYTRLLALRSQLTLARLQAEQAVATVQTAHAADAQRAVSPVQRGVLFGLLGAVLGLALAILRRRNSPVVHSADQLAGLDLAPLLPPLPRAPAGWARALRQGAPAPGVEHAVRLQTLQITRGSGPLGRPPVVVLSASSGTGTTFTAVNLALAAAGRHPTLLVWTGEVADELTMGLNAPAASAVDATGPNEPWTAARLRTTVSRTQVPDLSVLRLQAPGAIESAVSNGLLEALTGTGWGTVVDAPALDDSAVGFELAQRGAQVVFVVGLGVSYREDVVNCLRTLDQIGAAVRGVIVNRPRTPDRGGRGSFAGAPT
jgi:Mrp family chromosome partitioning ATPase